MNKKISELKSRVKLFSDCENVLENTEIGKNCHNAVKGNFIFCAKSFNEALEVIESLNQRNIELEKALQAEKNKRISHNPIAEARRAESLKMIVGG